MAVKPNIYRLILFAVLICTIFIVRTPFSNYELKNPDYSLGRIDGAISVEVDVVTFIDKTLESGLLTAHSQKSKIITGIHESLGAGVCVFDINLDGWVDIITLNGAGNTHYFGKPQWWQKKKSSFSVYLNKQDGSFLDVSHKSAIPNEQNSMGCSVGDLDGDGDQDLYLLNRGENQVWINTDQAVFIKAEIPSLAKGDQWSTNASISDFNGDGLLDIYTVNFISFQPNSLTFEASSGFVGEVSVNFDMAIYPGQSNQLLINQGGMKFKDETSSFAIANPQGRGLASIVIDINQDQKPDVLIANGSNSENKLFLNQGDSFSDESTAALVGILDNTPALTVDDFNLDGSLDLLVSTGATQFIKMYELNKAVNNIQFIDKSDDWQLNRETKINNVSWAPAVADFNMDGWPDVFLANGSLLPNIDSKTLSQSQPVNLLLNQDGSSFKKQKKPIVGETVEWNSARCAVSADFNNDGKPDVLVAVNNGLPRLLINEADSQSWLGLILDQSLVDQRPSINIETNQRIINKAVKGSSNGFCSQNNTHFLFSLKSEEVIEKVLILKQSKILAQYTQLKLNSYNTLSNSGAVNYIAPFKLNPMTSLVPVKPKIKLRLASWFLDNDNSLLASKVLNEIIIDGDSDEKKEAVSLTQRLPKNMILKMVPTLLRSNDVNVKRTAISLIRFTEDDRLARWLFDLIQDNNDAVACDAMASLEYFYAEEEAVILTKYAALDLLLKNVEGVSIEKKVCAILALGESERFRGTISLVHSLSDSVEKVRRSALISLGRLRDKSALQSLENSYLDKKESSLNRLYALQSIKQIDRNFDIEELVLKGLRSESKSSQLEGLSDYFSNHNDELFITLNKQKLSTAVVGWFNESKVLLTDIDRANYYVISNGVAPVSENALKKLLSSEDELAKKKALYLLINQTEFPAKTKYLTLLFNEGYDLNGIHNLRLTLENYLATLKGITANNKVLAARWLITQLTPSVRKQLFSFQLSKEYWEKEDKAIVDSLIQGAKNRSSLIDCDELFGLYEGHENATLMLNLLNNKFGNSVFSNCYQGTALTKAPVLIEEFLTEDVKIKSSAIAFICQRQERWARDYAHRTLNNDQMDMNLKLICLNSLSNNFSSSTAKLLSELYGMSEHIDIVLASAVKLSIKPNWVDENKASLVFNTKNAIVREDYSRAISFADILMPKYPSLIFPLFMNTN